MTEYDGCPPRTIGAWAYSLLRPRTRPIERLAYLLLIGTMVVVVSGCGNNVIPAAQETLPNNLVVNGSFDSLSSWNFNVDPAARVSFTQDKGAGAGDGYALHAHVTKIQVVSTDNNCPNDGDTGNAWLVQATQGGIQLRQGQHLYLTFYAKGDQALANGCAGSKLATSLIPRSFVQHQSPVTATLYSFFQADLQTTWQRYVVDVVPSASDDDALLTFNFGTSISNIWVSDVSLSPQVPAGVSWAPAAATSGSLATGIAPSLQGWKMVFDDEFTGEQVDPSKWNIVSDYPGGYTNSSLPDYKLKSSPDAGFWTPADVRQVNGSLQIISRARPIGTSNSSSGALTTEGKFSFTYGRVDIRARLPKGDGLWTTFWLLDVPPPGPVIRNAATQEIDMMEYLGQQPTKHYFVYHIGFTGDESCQYNSEDLSQSFHVYTLVWTATALDEYVDGIHRCHVTSNIPKVPMYMLIDTAVNGGFGLNADRTTPFPQYTSIDYVRVYQVA